jgi:hypothetical protein
MATAVSIELDEKLQRFFRICRKANALLLDKLPLIS